MNRDEKSPRGGQVGKTCRQTGSIAAYLAAEPAFQERQSFEAHLAACPACARELESARRTVEKLKQLAPEVVTHDLAPAILARLNAEELSGRRRRGAMSHLVIRSRVACGAQDGNVSRIRIPPTLYAVAALFLLFVGGALVFRTTCGRPRPECGGSAQTGAPALRTPSAHSEALLWLCRAQEPDGSWKAERWGGDRRFDVALSSLATLAILGSDAFSPRQERAVRKAVGYLVGQQNDTGEFGPFFDGTPYNQGMATLALLRAFETLRDETLRPSLDKAVALIRERQSPAGGWGYRDEASPEPNLSVTLWHIAPLKAAVGLGWPDAGPNLRRAMLWVAGVADGRGSFGYRRTGDVPAGSRSLTAMGAAALLDDRGRPLAPDGWARVLAQVRESAAHPRAAGDYYQTYFLAAAMKSMRDEANDGPLAALRGALVSRQVVVGAHSGSWPPDDRWGSVGGRVYATAMASLSLN